MKKILIIDDDAGLRQVLSMVFKRAGYEVATEGNGENILENKFEKPDIVVLDRNLADTDGLTVCRHLKEQPATRNIPVVMISASATAKLQAGIAGATDFLGKPFDVNHILKMVEFHSKYRIEQGHS
ncbi:MAG: response regulator [Chitinophagaceae bacterium]|nr:MAG: response regulator [Chitinophagaceae bacterium]